MILPPSELLGNDLVLGQDPWNDETEESCGNNALLDGAVSVFGKREKIVNELDARCIA